MTRPMSRTPEPETSMFDHHRSHELDRPLGEDAAAPIRAFLGAHSEALSCAATLLAGSGGACLVEDIADELRACSGLSRRCLRRLESLLDILALEHVDDEERPEWAYFALIDPASAHVEEICLLTDGLRDALTRAVSDQPPASRPRAAA